MEKVQRLTVALVEPQYPVNLGHTARVMKNFGYMDLLLVNPQVNMFEARKYSSHATDVLENAKHVTLDYLRRFDTIISTTAISGGKVLSLRHKTISLPELPNMMDRLGESVCLIFGRDTTGLTNEELRLSDVVVNIPTNHPYPTLNLSHALAILLYELSKRKVIGQEVASREMVARTVSGYVEVARSLGTQSYRLHVIENVLTRLLGRARPTPRENTVMLGIARKMRLALKRELDIPIVEE